MDRHVPRVADRDRHADEQQRPRHGGTNPPTDPANPRPSNVYGHIIKWFYRKDFTEPTFGWDIFALGGDPANPAHGSTIVGDKYGSPDGIYVAPSGRLVDPDGRFEQHDQLRRVRRLRQQPDAVRGRERLAKRVASWSDRMAARSRRCFVTPDERTMFVGIQHPGEAPSGANDPAHPKRFSSWPEGDEGGRPRSACIVITKDDGGVIGS